MSKVDYEYRALPGGVPSADGVLSNFEEISSAMKNITSENVERGSIFTRQVSSSSKGVSWKRQGLTPITPLQQATMGQTQTSPLFLWG